MEIKKGDTLKIHTPALDKYTPASTDTVTVLAVFKTGKIKVWSEYGHGYSIDPQRFSEFGGRIEVFNAVLL